MMTNFGKEAPEMDTWDHIGEIFRENKDWIAWNSIILK